ncbi:hypothetical protein [Cohnella yongneupensis]|uniref:Uncharacterized protein n=1 Tax=Cohnella yongneupensis TaxID=425006 RepID=A0ABW0R1L4_9BACL
MTDKDSQSQAITVSEFAKLVAEELDFTWEEQVEFAGRAEAIFNADIHWKVPSATYAYYMDDAFRNRREISREEAAALMAIASELIGDQAPKLSSLEAVQTISRFKDAKLVAAWAMPALATAVRQAWMGCPKQEIKPKHYMTPNEAVTIVKRFATDMQ